MATKRKSTSGRKSTGRKTKKAGIRNSNTPNQFSWESEVLLFVILAFSIILFITNIGKGGVVGNAFSHFFFGLLGVLSYAFPFILFFGAAFLISNIWGSKKNQQPISGRAIMKAVALVVFFVFLCMFAQLIHTGKTSMDLIQAFKDCADTKFGGGFVGAAIAGVLVKAFGLAGAYVIDFAVLILCLVLLTEKSLFKALSHNGRRVYDSARESSRLRQERAMEREIERSKRKEATPKRKEVTPDSDEDVVIPPVKEKKVKRSERKLEGVTKDTKLKPSDKRKPVSDQMSEMDLSHVYEVEAVPTEVPGKGFRKTPEHYQLDADAIADVITAQQSERFWDEYKGPEIHIPGERMEKKPEPRKTVQEKKPVPVKRTVERAIPDPDVDDAYEEDMPVTDEPARKQRKTKQSMAEISAEVSDISQSIEDAAQDVTPKYVYPLVSLLQKGDPNQAGDSRKHLQEMSAKLQMTLQTFGVNARVTNVICGPSVTQYEIQPEMGVKVNKIKSLEDDIKLNLAVPDIRIEAPIPGKAAVGIEVPNKENVTVAFRDLIESEEFRKTESKISFCAGKDIAGNVIVADIAKMPHLLIAGATGSGKSVCINTIIMSILYKADPNEVKLIMIDPKMVELSVYNNIPHLLIPVVTDPKKAAGALHWAVAEMTDRYNKFKEYGVRNLKGYNQKVESIKDIDDPNKPQKMPQLVVIVDELADLMMVAAGDVEEAICRLAQLARAAGIHLIIATQRPSVNVITGLIKANMPSRIAFSVTSGVDSRTILDMNGAEKLLGKGDMLFYPQGYAKPLRVQGAFVSDKEVADVVEYIIDKNGQVSYNSEIEEQVKNTESSMMAGSGFTASADDRDAHFMDAGRYVIEKEKGSIGMLQRSFKIGFNRAARIMDQLEEAGVVGPEEGTKPRRVLMTLEEFEQLGQMED